MAFIDRKNWPLKQGLGLGIYMLRKRCIDGIPKIDWHEHNPFFYTGKISYDKTGGG